VARHQGNFKVKVENHSDRVTQLALQGPLAEEILQPLIENVDLSQLKTFAFAWGSIKGEEVLVSRTGYTGEDGFEIYTYSSNPSLIWETIMNQGKRAGLLPVGLGARDTLRLEACLLLYGNDIDETTTVLEAGLGWIVKFKKGDFLGREVLLKQKEEGVKRKIVGFELLERGIPRPHYPVYVNGQEVSQVTSGTYSPFLKKSIGLTYLPVDYTQAGTIIEVGIRGKKVKAQVVPTPFYKREKK
jgi:aminomethyltransferase